MMRRVGSCPRTKAGKATDAVTDFSDRGGMLIISRVILSLSKFPASLRGRRPDAALFDDHRRLHASPIAIITKRLEKLPIALVLWVLQATTDPDLGVVKRALGLITLGPHCPQMRFDETLLAGNSTVGDRFRRTTSATTGNPQITR
jgi:hypothetical protein